MVKKRVSIPERIIAFLQVSAEREAIRIMQKAERDIKRAKETEAVMIRLRKYWQC